MRRRCVPRSAACALAPGGDPVEDDAPAPPPLPLTEATRAPPAPPPLSTPLRRITSPPPLCPRAAEAEVPRWRMALGLVRPKCPSGSSPLPSTPASAPGVATETMSTHLSKAVITPRMETRSLDTSTESTATVRRTGCATEESRAVRARQRAATTAWARERWWCRGGGKPGGGEGWRGRGASGASGGSPADELRWSAYWSACWWRWCWAPALEDESRAQGTCGRRGRGASGAGKARMLEDASRCAYPPLPSLSA
mmetsp:Transcript_23360/g.63342  ORF Transcript_23360/g.63342 Transcript_23360/m.63342 type:complete len:254 (+) Transcript_23360:1937-2698(+)